MNDNLLSDEFIINMLKSMRKPKRQFKTYILIDNAAGLYKIGRTVDVDKRFAALSVANPSISVVMVIDDNVENELHKTYSTKRVKSEWFCLTDKDINDIKNKYLLAL